MALDHFISQVYLKNFNAPELGHLMYATRKSDLKVFTPSSKSICRIEEGSSNHYLEDERAIEEFLKSVEPKYNASVRKVLDDNIDQECIYVLSGLVSYILTCSPAAMRIHSELFRATVEEEIRFLDKQSLLPPPPVELGGEDLPELIEAGKLKIKIDEKYPQAHGIAQILSHVAMFGNSTWEILINTYQDSPFFTSDYPIVIEPARNQTALNRVIPLTPTLAVRIIPDRMLDRELLDFSFGFFKYRKKKLTRTDVRSINQQIVRCAESLVLSSQNEKWVSRFVQRNSAFRIEPETIRLPHGDGATLFFTQKVAQIQNQCN